MSDDNPTERFPEQGDTPTERISATEIQEDLAEEKQKSRGLLIGLIIAGVLLLTAIIVLVFFLGRASGEPDALPLGDTPSATPTTDTSPTPEPTDDATPTPDPTPTEEPQQPQQPQPPQQPSGPTITQFKTASTNVYCNTQSPNPSHQYISFSWKTANGSQIFFGVDTNDASAASLFTNLPPMGNSQNDFPPGYTDFEYGCPDASHKYTLTVIDGSGHKSSKSVTITNKGDLQ